MTAGLTARRDRALLPVVGGIDTDEVARSIQPIGGTRAQGVCIMGDTRVGRAIATALIAGAAACNSLLPSEVTASVSPTSGLTARAAAASRSESVGFTAVSFHNGRVGCVGEAGAIDCTRDGGSSWARTYHGTAEISRLQILGRSSGWAIASGTLLRLVSDGTWARVNGPPGATQLYFVTAQTGWTLAGGGSLYETTNGGRAFQMLSSISGLRAIFFRSRRAGWAIGPHGEILKTADGGVSWSRIATLTTGSSWSQGAASIVFSSATAGWILLTLGSACMSQMPYVVYRTLDGGRHWRRTLVGPNACGLPDYPRNPNGLPGYAGGISLAGTRGAVVSLVNPVSEKIYVLASRGNAGTWSGGTAVARVSPATTSDLSFVSWRVGWVVTGGAPTAGRVFHTGDGRRTWKVQLRD